MSKYGAPTVIYIKYTGVAVSKQISSEYLYSVIYKHPNTPYSRGDPS